jgi:hypothetical protein
MGRWGNEKKDAPESLAAQGVFTARETHNFTDLRRLRRFNKIN